MNRRRFFELGAAAATGLLTAAVAKPTRPNWRRKGSPVADDGTRLFVRDWGAGSPVLFLAGWTLSSDFWRYQMLSLKERGYRVIAYDRRGHGRSDDPGRGYDFNTLADDLATVIEGRQLDKVAVVAHSMASGEVTRYFARHGGHKVGKVIFVGPTTPFLMKTADNPSGIDPALMAAARARLAADFPAQIDAQIGPFFTPQTAPGTIEWIKRMMMDASMQAVIELAKEFQETDFRAELRKMNVPTLVVHGDKDASAPLPLTGKRTVELLPNARLKIVEDAPHGLPLTHVELLNAEISTFLTS